MSWTNFLHLIPKLPTPEVASRRVLDFLARQSGDGETAYARRFTSSRFFDIAEDLSRADTARLLAWLVSQQVLDQVIRVESPGRGGIQDFASLDDVPDEIEDWRHDGQRMRVLPENLQIYYKLHPNRAK